MNLEKCKEFALSKNGLCLSTEYKNNNTNLLWQCKNKHKWEARWNNIQKGKWCLLCSSRKPPLFEEIQKIAINRNGKLLSNKYINNSSYLLWECSKGHQWQASFANVKHNNTWCPYCTRFKTESKCREFLNLKFNIKLIKKRIKYENSIIEFDGIDFKNKIAFEYHGIQHYEFPNYWHKTKEEFLYNTKKDKLKEQYAKKNNIKLIIIPYNVNIEKFIKEL